MPLAAQHADVIQKDHLPKILIIDDEHSVQMAMDLALRNENYRLFFADNGKQGLDIFHEEAPELIFLDLKMPVMDGYKFLETVQVSHDSPFSLVVVTGHGDDREIERCYRMGIDFFLKKPLNMVEICGLARRCIELKNLEKERARLLAELQEARDRLEQRVAERTSVLADTVTSLEEEIKKHSITADKLEKKTQALQESNIALQVLLRSRDGEKAQYEIELIGKIEKMVQPYLDKLKGSKLNDSQKNILDFIEQNLKAIAAPFLYNQLPLFIKLTAKEIQVANMIKQGMSTKEISSVLDISARTVETHRYQIRKKMGIEGKTTNLRQELIRTF